MDKNTQTKKLRFSSSIFFQEGATLDIQRVFLLGLVLGTVAIIGGQILENLWISVLASVFVLSIYIFVGLYRDAAKSILPQFADSIYYMGFIFTLEALLASLYSFRNTEVVDVGHLVSNFSLALLTTIIGLSARIIISNFSTETKQTRQFLIDELNNATLTLTQNARAISMKLEVLNTEVHDTIKESLGEATKGMENTVSTVDKAMSETISNFVSKINSIDLPQDIFTQKMGASIDQFVQQVKDAQNNLKDITKQQKGVRDGSQRIAKSLERTVNQIDRLHKTLDNTTNSLENDNETRQQFTSLAKDIIELSAASRTISEEIMKQSERSSNVTKTFDDLLCRIRKFPDEVNVATERLRKNGEEINNTMLGLENERMEVFLQATEKQRNSIVSIDNRITKQLEMMEHHQQALESILNDSRKSLGAVNKHFIEAVEYVSKRLRD